MVRRVFFSFHYEHDHWRANPVRNSWVTQDNREAAGFIDSAKWEEVKRSGEAAIKRWIKEQLNNTSVTVVLVGSETYDRDWVNYEIKQSYERGNGLVGIYIHNIEDKQGKISRKGKNPLSRWHTTIDGRRRYLSDIFNTYYWKRDNGYQKLGNWVEEAAKIADR